MWVLILLYMCHHTAIYVSSYRYICVIILLYMCSHTPDVAPYEFFAESAVKQKPCCARVSRGHTHTNTFSCQSRVYTILKLVTQVYAHTGSIRKRCLPIACPLSSQAAPLSARARKYRAQSPGNSRIQDIFRKRHTFIDGRCSHFGLGAYI